MIITNTIKSLFKKNLYPDSDELLKTVEATVRKLNNELGKYLGTRKWEKYYENHIRTKVIFRDFMKHFGIL